MRHIKVNTDFQIARQNGDFSEFQEVLRGYYQPEMGEVTFVQNGFNAIRVFPDNLRILAAILRCGHDMYYSGNNGGDSCAPALKQSIMDKKYPLICLVLYLRDTNHFITLRDKLGNNARDSYTHLRDYAQCRATFDSIASEVEADKAVLAQGRMYLTQQQFRAAFDCFTAVAKKLTTDFYHRDDVNLIPFYQKEAINVFQQATQALIYDIQQQPNVGVMLGEQKKQQQLKRLELVTYISSVVLDKITDREIDMSWFMRQIANYQLKPAEQIDWQDPRFDVYNPAKSRTTHSPVSPPPTRRGSGSSSDATSSFRGSQEMLA